MTAMHDIMFDSYSFVFHCLGAVTEMMTVATNQMRVKHHVIRSRAPTNVISVAAMANVLRYGKFAAI